MGDLNLTSLIRCLESYLIKVLIHLVVFFITLMLIEFILRVIRMLDVYLFRGLIAVIPFLISISLFIVLVYVIAVV